MTEPRRRRILGIPAPVLVVTGIVLLGILILGFLAGPIGQALFNISLPEWMTPKSPAIHLPAPVIFHFLGLPVTNTILAGWITAIVLVVVCWLVTRRMSLVPGRLQGVFEAVLGWMLDLCVSLAGEKNGRKFFPLVATIFLFVAFNAWLSLIPGFGSIFGIFDGHEYEFLRGSNTDVNTPLALAIISFVFVTFWGLKALGTGWLKQYFNFGPLFRSIGQVFKGKLDVMGIFSSIIAVFVGLLELLSRFITIISFTFRLFGNMTAGEILVIIGAFLIPFGLNWLIYGFEMLVGLVQALVFSILTLVFATMAVTVHDAEEHPE